MWVVCKECEQKYWVDTAPGAKKVIGHCHCGERAGLNGGLDIADAGKAGVGDVIDLNASLGDSRSYRLKGTGRALHVGRSPAMAGKLYHGS